MKSTNERQNEYRERMYKAGFKEKRAWVKRREVKILKKPGINEFTRALKSETSELSKNDLERLLNLLIKIANGRKEEIKLRKKK
jgi:ABC-type antimicrobial peptide transport system ATPase subunit